MSWGARSDTLDHEHQYAPWTTLPFHQDVKKPWVPHFPGAPLWLLSTDSYPANRNPECCVLSCFSRVRLFCNPVDCSLPLSMRFSRQECWSGLPYPPPRNLPDPEMEPTSLTSSALAGRFFIASATWEAPYRNPLVVKQSQWVAFLPSLWPVSLPWAMCRDFVSLSLRISHLGHKNWICILRTKGLLVDSSFFRYGQIR